MNATVDSALFRDATKEAVREALAQKEEADRSEKTAEVLESAKNRIVELTDAVDAKEAELAASKEEKESLLSKVAELEAKTAELQEKIESFNKEKEQLEDRAFKAEAELAGIAADRRLEQRMNELASAKVASVSESARAAQSAKVREMDDEAFNSYKEELVSMRAELEAELKAAASQEVPDGGSEEVADVPPPDIEKVRKEDAAATAAATLNIEVASEDLRAKYARMAEAMANSIKNSQL